MSATVTFPDLFAYLVGNVRHYGLDLILRIVPKSSSPLPNPAPPVLS